MEQRIYSTKLFEALRQVRRNYSQAGKVSGGHQVREETDRVLTVSAKGRTRWSRAILTSRLGMRLGGGNKHKTATSFREEREICPKAGLRFQRRERKRRTEREEKNGG
ncbi:transcription factor bHLH148-like [Alnus glutinosa]|uniref:transcription factor bHLH148-like n=1 Tax=Alnus glutinosa TaxID=3517 RepID=UPI002D775D50|nr:transcription factor bHLH148-like [Alnus glutinosa]